MVYKDLQSFIKKLETCGELKKIDVPVSPELEITEITDRVSKAHGPALLFRDVDGSRYPVLMNAMGSYERMSMALGVKKLDDIAEEVQKYLDVLNDLSISGLVKSVPRLFRLLNVFPRRSLLSGRKVCGFIFSARAEMLAAGRGAVYYASRRFYKGSKNETAERRYVPFADP